MNIINGFKSVVNINSLLLGAFAMGAGLEGAKENREKAKK